MWKVRVKKINYDDKWTSKVHLDLQALNPFKKKNKDKDLCYTFTVEQYKKNSMLTLFLSLHYSWYILTKQTLSSKALGMRGKNYSEATKKRR